MAQVSYAVPADLDSGINPGAISAVTNQQKLDAITQASGIIDSYLRSQFVLPLVQVGSDIKRACIDISIYFVMVGRGYNPDAGSDPGIRQRYEDRVAWLKLVGQGTVTPDITDSSSSASEGTPSARPIVISSSQRGFSSRGDPRGKTSPFQGD